MSYTIWHNPRCRKSRETLQLLQSKGVDPSIRLYLTDTPSTHEIESALSKLGVEPRGLMRTKEALYRELGLKDPALTAQSLVSAMAENPSLIERPLVIHEDQAALGRPPENVLALL